MRKLIIGIATLVALAGSVPMAQAQLVMIEKDYRVSRIDTVHSRLEIQNMKDQNVTLFADVNGSTQVLSRHHHAMSWTQLHRGDVVHIKGGLQAGGQISAKTIVLQ